MNKTPDRLLAEKLLKISSIQLQPESPFLLASGWNSPIYADVRKALSYVEVRNFIKIELARAILERFPGIDAIAGVAKGAVAFAAITSDALGLPFAIVRRRPKDHGLENMIEGNLKPGWKVVVIEDIITTGNNLISSIKAIHNAACDVVGIVSVFDFEFPEAIEKINAEEIPMRSLLKYSTMLEEAMVHDYLAPMDVETIKDWHEDPENWTPAVGPEE